MASRWLQEINENIEPKHCTSPEARMLFKIAYKNYAGCAFGDIKNLEGFKEEMEMHFKSKN
jgi:metal-dependent hydrolase (beta-lactamase superfamily II)